MKMTGRAVMNGEERETYVYDNKEEREKHALERESEGWDVLLITTFKKNGLSAFHIRPLS